MSEVRAILDGISIIHLRREIDRLRAENAELRSALDSFLKDTAKVRAILMAASLPGARG